MSVAGYFVDAPIPHDHMVSRDRLSRLAVALLGGAASLAIPFRIAGYLASYAGNDTLAELASCASLGGGAIAYGFYFLENMLIKNKGLTGNVTTDEFAGTQVVYGPGLHVAYPWEDRAKDFAYPLKIDRKTFEVKLNTATSPMTAQCEVWWRFSLPRLQRAINLTEGAVEYNVQGFVDGVINKRVSPLTAADAVANGVAIVNQVLRHDFMSLRHSKQRTTPSQFEEQFGVQIVAVFLKHFEYPEKVRNALEGVAMAHAVHEIACALYKFGNLDADLRSGKVDLKTYTLLIQEALVLADLGKLNIVSLGGADTFAKSMMGVITATKGAA